MYSDNIAFVLLSVIVATTIFLIFTGEIDRTQKAKKPALLDDNERQSMRKLHRIRGQYIQYLQDKLRASHITYYEELEWQDEEELRQFNQKMDNGSGI